jgi:hypothetical protein
MRVEWDWEWDSGCVSEGGEKGVRKEVSGKEARGSRRREVLSWKERSFPYTICTISGLCSLTNSLPSPSEPHPFLLQSSE